jgi:hypothetical protein
MKPARIRERLEASCDVQSASALTPAEMMLRRLTEDFAATHAGMSSAFRKPALPSNRPPSAWPSWPRREGREKRGRPKRLSAAGAPLAAARAACRLKPVRRHATVSWGLARPSWEAERVGCDE